MSADSVVAVCAIVIAVASLAVSVYEVQATRQHNRHSVRPILQLRRSWRPGHQAGVRLTNVGLGPAVVVSTMVAIDDEAMGVWNKPVADRIREGMPVHPAAVTFGADAVLPADYEEFLLSVDDYDPDADAAFAQYVNGRVTMEIRYESLYGGENFSVVLRPRP